MLEHALSKVDFSVGVAIFMLPSNLNLNTWKKEGCNKKILVSNTGMKIGSNRNINRDHKKLLDVPKTMTSADRHEPAETIVPHNLKILTERHHYEKLAITLLIVGTGLVAYHFW